MTARMEWEADGTRRRLAPRPTILVASADADVRIIVATLLAHAGFAARPLEQPDRAVDAALERRDGCGPCALVVTDFPTYASSGRTITELLREDPRTAVLPILNATTHAFPTDLERAAAAGVNASLVLPASGERIVAEVEGLLADAH